MTRRQKPKAKLETTVETRPGTSEDFVYGVFGTEPFRVIPGHEEPLPWQDGPVVEWRQRAGIAELSQPFRNCEQSGVAPGTTDPEPPRSPGKLNWQHAKELRTLHLAVAAYKVLSDPEHGALIARPIDELRAEVERHFGLAIWAKVATAMNIKWRTTEERIASMSEEYKRVLDFCGYDWDFAERQDILKSIPSSEDLILALWAEAYAEPLSPVWLAAMASHALEVVEDKFAAGYLSALLDQKLKNEELFERGLKNAKSTSAGGQARAAAERENRTAVLVEMERLIGTGMSVREAASRAYSAGIGTGPDANRQAWYREKRNSTAQI